MEKIIKVRVNNRVPVGLAAQEFEGEVLEVTVNVHGNYQPTEEQYRKLRERGARNCNGFGIGVEHAVVIEEEKPFELKSGMTFLDNKGKVGLIVGTDNGLIALFGNKKGAFQSYGKRAGGYLDPLNGDKWSTYFVEVFEGMNWNSAAALPGNGNGKCVWKRVEDKKVVLNSEHTAVVTKDSVTVGCQVIPMSAVREIVEAADKM